MLARPIRYASKLAAVSGPLGTSRDRPAADGPDAARRRFLCGSSLGKASAGFLPDGPINRHPASSASLLASGHDDDGRPPLDFGPRRCLRVTVASAAASNV